ncbi:MAG: TIGR01777 family oxidoreductase [Kofleriaceae bacterium]
MKVVVTGATGFMGSALVPALVKHGDEVVVLSRDGAKAKAKLGVEAVSANLDERGAWENVLVGAGAIVHLAGESVAGKRLDARQKQLVRDSRVEVTRTIVEAIAAMPAGERPRALISASGTDYYPFAVEGALDDDEVTEADPPSEMFLGRVCRDWEKEASAATALGLRVAMMRTGLVMGGSGGPLAEMIAPFKLFAGGKLGNGKQFVPWIHLDDAVAVYVAAVHDDRYAGPINLVAGSVRNKVLAKAIGKAMHRPAWLPAPGFALKLVVGELAEYLLHGRNVVPKRLTDLDFRFAHPNVEEAVASAIAQPSSSG